MDEAAKARVARLKSYCRRRRLCVGPDGEASASALSARMEERGYKGSYAYWSDILREGHRSFAAAKAREVERALEMPKFHLDGGADWPFDSIDPAKVTGLSLRDIGRLEGVLVAAAEKFGLDIASEDSGPVAASGKPPRALAA